jgi:hypothetical protein
MKRGRSGKTRKIEMLERDFLSLVGREQVHPIETHQGT